MDPDAVVAAIATADLVTTAVGPHILKFVAPVIARGIARGAGLAPLQVMACENAINATDILARPRWPRSGGRRRGAGRQAVFANTAVDRIVPNQEPGQGLDVTVETFYEWVIDRSRVRRIGAGDLPAPPLWTSSRPTSSASCSR